MYKHLGLLVLLVVAMLPSVVADSHTLSEANRFLSAEAQRAISAEGDALEASMKAYQDENFQIFDTRISNFLEETMYKVALMVAGISFLVMGFTSIVIVRSIRKNAAKQYIQDKHSADKQVAADADIQEAFVEDGLHGDVAGMQEEQWYPQESRETVGTLYGQEQASNNSAMNSWQHQPAYAGSWKPPGEDVQKDFGSRPWANQDFDVAKHQQEQQDAADMRQQLDDYEGQFDDQVPRDYSSDQEYPQEDYYTTAPQQESSGTSEFDDIYSELLDEVSKESNNGK